MPGFPREQVNELLVACHRRCCICHRFCGVKIETDHIVPKGDHGPDTIENAIPVCFECHADIHSYNDKHPRGRKFQPDELTRHKEQWLNLCRTRPEILVQAIRDADVGPVQALVDELEFNLVVTQYPTERDRGCLFHDEQFRRAIAEGAISTLDETLKAAVVEAYVFMGRSNQRVLAELNQDAHSMGMGRVSGLAQIAFTETIPRIQAAHEQLLRFFSRE